MNYPVRICFDYETTGLETEEGAEPIELAAIAIDPVTFEEVGRFPARLMRVQKPELASPKALEVNGKTLEQVMKGEDPGVVHWEFFQWAKTFIPAEDMALAPRRRRRPMLMGHNVKFDIGFLKWATREYIPGGMKTYDEIFDYHTRCTVEAAAFWLNDVIKFDTSVSLINLTKLLGIHHVAHEAMGDVEATVTLYRHLVGQGREFVKRVRQQNAEKQEATA